MLLKKRMVRLGISLVAALPITFSRYGRKKTNQRNRVQLRPVSSNSGPLKPQGKLPLPLLVRSIGRGRQASGLC